MNDTVTTQILHEVFDERRRQWHKWGQQDFPDGTGPVWIAMRDSYQKQTQVDLERGTSTMNSVLLEEVFEALSESDPAALRKELIQVAAVAVQWVEKLWREGAA